jgi:hypothetical protein
VGTDDLESQTVILSQLHGLCEIPRGDNDLHAAPFQCCDHRREQKNVGGIR